MDAFNIGTVVRLISGGPEMTVAKSPPEFVEFNGEGATVFCTWFDKSGKVHERGFHRDQLESVAPPYLGPEFS